VISQGNFYSDASPKQEGKNQEEEDNKNEVDLQNMVSTKSADPTAKPNEKISTYLIHDIDLKIERGKFYMVFGDIGAGKSTLLLSMLN
jgi:ABC-type bacteriocin/lantibiotic exporter with double-glycine peptidase domain